MTDQIKQKEILSKIITNGGQISVGALGSSVGSKVLSGEKSGTDEWKHNLYLLLDDDRAKEIGEGMGITSSVRITSSGEEWLKSFSKNEIINKIVGLQQQIDKIIDLDKKGLLERHELYDFKDRIEAEIKEFVNQTDDETQRHFKKITSGWKNVSKPGYTNPGEAEKHLQPTIDFISQSVHRLTGKDFKTEVYIPAGKPFDGRLQLQSIFNTAQKEIWIVDNYLQKSILSILSSVAENKPEFIFKFLIGNKNKSKFDGFTADLSYFASQFPLIRIECKQHENLHDRFILLDNKLLYTVGSSLDNVGEKGNFITLIEDQKSKDVQMGDMINLWDTANDIFKK